MTTPVSFESTGKPVAIISPPGWASGMTIFPDADPGAIIRSKSLDNARQWMLERNAPNNAVTFQNNPGVASISTTKTGEQLKSEINRRFEELAKDDLYGTIQTFMNKVKSEPLGYWEAMLQVSVRAALNCGLDPGQEYQRSVIETSWFKKSANSFIRFYANQKDLQLFNNGISIIVESLPTFLLSQGCIKNSGGSHNGLTRKYKYMKFIVSSKRFINKKSYKKSTRNNKRQSRRK